jgi:hypothetical protein
MPFTRLLKVSGMNGSARTRSISFSVGMAREEAEFRLSIRCVLNSARMKRGNVTWSVVSRTPSGDIESARIWAL